VAGRFGLQSSRGLLTVTLALLSGGFQVAVAFRVDLRNDKFQLIFK